MSDDAQKGGSFDLQKIQNLVELMEEHGLTEISLQRGDERWRLKRGSEQVFASQPPVFAPPPMAAPPVAASPAEAAPAPAAAEVAGTLIKSPTVGTFYEAPSPDDPPFIKIGDSVQADSVVCIVEAMKVFNQIPAEVAGTIAECLVKNGDSVEFGQPLFRVKPN